MDDYDILLAERDAWKAAAVALYGVYRQSTSKGQSRLNDRVKARRLFEEAQLMEQSSS
jgi:hypothetical protein